MGLVSARARRIDASIRVIAIYVGWLNDRGYGGPECTDWLPHDAAAHELGTGKTRVEMLVSMGRSIAMVPRFIRADGISATRLELRRM
jgi:hypothetical protein